MAGRTNYGFCVDFTLLGIIHVLHTQGQKWTTVELKFKPMFYKFDFELENNVKIPF